jgi:hypothetical protein
LKRRRTFVFFLAFSAVIAVLYGFRYFHGKHTEYCPLSHKFSDTANCIVLHKSGQRALIRHADRYTQDYYFEIVDGGRSYKYEIPEYSLNGRGPKRFSIRLVDGEDNAVTINGERFELLPLINGGG